MNDVAPVTGSVFPQRIGPNQARRGHETIAPAAPQDEVEISAVARALSRIQALPDIRVEKVEQIREAIANNTYESAEKLEYTINRLLEDLAG